MTEIKTPAPELVDEYGELQRQVDEFKPTAERHKKVKEEIEACYADGAATSEFTAYGFIYQAQIGAKKWERTIVSMAKLFAALKKESFLALCGFTLKNLDGQNLPEAQLERIVRKEQTGSRAIKPVLRNPVPAEKAA